MCWSPTVTLGMVGLGAVATAVAIHRKEPPAISATLGYFTAMEALQAAGYGVLGQCGNPANQVVTWLSILHIVFQPFFINAFAMELVPEPVRQRVRTGVFVICGLSAALMLTQLYPFSWAGRCQVGSLLCAERLCTVPGGWHLGWEVPYNGMLVPLNELTGMTWSFPSYTLAAFVVPLLYGAWRFVLFHLVAGPGMATLLSGNPIEIPAVWCLFSIGILLIALSPAIRRRFEWRRAAPIPA